MIQVNAFLYLCRFDTNRLSDSVETEITVTGGVVGPTLSQYDTLSPINVTSVLGKPQVNIRSILPLYVGY